MRIYLKRDAGESRFKIVLQRLQYRTLLVPDIQRTKDDDYFLGNFFFASKNIFQKCRG